MRLSICQDLSRYTNASINTCPLIMRVFILCPLWRQLRSPFSVHSHVGELWLGDRRRGGDGGGCHRYLAGEPRDQPAHGLVYRHGCAAGDSIRWRLLVLE